jgi:hypothetical protein
MSFKTGSRPTVTRQRAAGSVAALLMASTFLFSPASAGALQPLALQSLDRLASVKQWTAEVIVTSDCDRTAFDGSRTAIHNRIVTTYLLTQRVSDAPALTWRGKASTSYRWSVTTGGRDNREVEESEASFEVDGELQLTDVTRITTAKPPGRPFTKTRYFGEAIVDRSTSNDLPPTAELFDAPLPRLSGTLSGRRMESAYSLFGGAVLNCPAQRQWTLR